MTELATTIIAVRDRIARYRGKSNLNEENTKATLIDPILRALGWDLEDLDEVQREYKAKRRDKPVDYGLLLMRTPRLFIEAKALHQDLGDRRWSNQIMGYAAVAGVEWVVLTNGDEYRIYNAHAAVEVDQKLFRSFKLSDKDGAAEDTLALLGRDRLQENRLRSLWDAHFVDRQVKIALDELFEPGDDASFVRLLRGRIEGVTPADLRASLRRARIEITFPTPIDAGDHAPREPKESVRAAASRKREPGDHKLRLAKPTRRTPVSSGVTLGDLIGAGVIRPPVDLSATYKGVTVRARIEPNGTVSVDGQTTNSPSSAANVARETVLAAEGKPQSVRTNGWTFWSFRDSAGGSRSLATARDDFGAARGASNPADSAS